MPTTTLEQVKKEARHLGIPLSKDGHTKTKGQLMASVAYHKNKKKKSPAKKKPSKKSTKKKSAKKKPSKKSTKKKK